MSILRFRSSRALVLAVGVAGATVAAEEAPVTRSTLSAEERAAVRDRIAGMREAVDTLRYTAVREVYQRFKSILDGGPNALLGLYLECVHEVDFKRKGLPEKAFRDWKKANLDGIETPGYLLALRLQLGYLVLSMEASAVRTPVQLQALLDGLLAHVEAVSDAEPRLGDAAPILNQGVMGFAFADAHGLARFITIAEKYQWVGEPGNIFQIYDRTLHPIAGLSDDPAYVARIWSSRIQAETAHAARATAASPHEMIRFQSFTLPTLQWRRARDLFDAGSQRQALDEMMQVLEVSPNHPRAADWLRELEGRLELEGD